LIRRPTILAITLALSCVFLHAQTVDEIIAKSIEARGGVRKLKAVQTQRMTGHISFGPNLDGVLLVEIKRPAKLREELNLGGKVMIRTTNGKEGWVINQLEEDPGPKPVSPSELANMLQKADFDRPLVDYKEKGNKVELVGREKLDGKDAFKLKVTLKDGQIRYDYIGTSSYLELKWEGRVKKDDEDFQAESFFHDYRSVEGIMYPFEIDSDSPGSESQQKIVFEKIEINPALDDARFEKPSLPATSSQ
jgi:hypothetical protein